jgi:polyhydroxybutyrate depolymerase
MRPRAPVGLAATVAVTVALAGCSSTAKKVVATPARTTSPAVTPSSASPTPSPSATHLAAPTRTPGPTRPTLHIAPSTAHPAVRICHLPAGPQTIDGRLVILDLPARFPAPVVIDYHGGNRSAVQEHGYTGLGPLGASRGFIVATPNGTNGLWNFPGTEPLPDDAAFTQDIATLLAFGGCSNGRVYTAGISDGADMAVAAACRVPAVRAVFAVAPSITPRGGCTRKPYLEVHGTADPIVPYSGSASGNFADLPSEPVASRLPFWTAGCSGPAAGASPGAGTQVQRWGCAAGRTVQLDTVDGGGHTWPGAVGPDPAAGLGARASWSADSAALDFFLSE